MKKTLRKSHLPTLLKDDVLELWIEQGFVLLPVGVLLRVAGLGAGNGVLEWQHCMKSRNTCYSRKQLTLKDITRSRDGSKECSFSGMSGRWKYLK